MASRIEDYALLSDLHTGPLVSRTGSIDWLCFPRFDSPSIFGALLGTEEHGHWLLAPATEHATVVERRYLDSTFVLQTDWSTETGAVRVTDFMPVGDRRASIVRRIEGLEGTVQMHQVLRMRFDYARVLPWVSRVKDADGATALLAIAGPDALALRGPHIPHSTDHRHHGEFTVEAGQTLDFELLWYPSHRPIPAALDVDAVLKDTVDYWQDWAADCSQDGKYAEQVKRSLLVLRALSHEDTGGIVAAPTTSLPEDFGGARNWDYRFCWLRDAALTLEAMLTHGYAQEALTWRNWLLRAVAGDPEDLQIMYGLGGERGLQEEELPHLPGYEHSTPVRIGNGAVHQYQADVVGEVMVALEKLRKIGGAEDHFSWPLQRSLLGFAERHVAEKDQGLWEMRGEPQYFTHSRVMMWAAFDAGVRAVREHGLDGPVELWERLRDQLREEVLSQGFNQELSSFTQTYGGHTTDASLLVLPQVGFIPYSDEKMLGTVARIERELIDADGLLLRYRTETGLDGLEPGEHPFLACSFWLVGQYAHSGRFTEATALMDRLVGLGNELGLLSEEYSIQLGRMVGNYPQAFSHLALVGAADALQTAAQRTRA
ncbi:glycoside hydrolase family 15 protein [Psychromicrobium sp. YIM B11713]|uniref:glycoside hydrolase family 15 protein n=1 Tax=Psychromicrobium sp. YIM B11713 TaxID=3145233 RepID=UPI00374FC0B6